MTQYRYSSPAKFGQYAKEARQVLGLSLKDMSNACGIGDTTLFNIESGETRKPRPAVAEKILTTIENKMQERIERHTALRINLETLGRTHRLEHVVEHAIGLGFGYRGRYTEREERLDVARRILRALHRETTTGDGLSLESGDDL